MQHNMLQLHEAFYENALFPSDGFARIAELSGRQIQHDQTHKEPLITKAYDAFRKQNKNGQSDLLPTDEYIEELAKRQIDDEIENKANHFSDVTLPLNSSKTIRAKDRSTTRLRGLTQALSMDKQVNIKTVQLNAQES